MAVPLTECTRIKKDLSCVLSLYFFLFPFYVATLTLVMKHVIQYEIYGPVDSGSVLSDLASFLLRKGRKEVLHDRLTETFIQPLRVLWTSTASYRVIQTWIICKELYLVTYPLCSSLLFYTCALRWYESWRYFSLITGQRARDRKKLLVLLCQRRSGEVRRSQGGECEYLTCIL